jgi:hypothetical protein
VRLAPLVLFAAACQNAPRSEAVASASSAPAAAPSTPPSAPPAEKPWFEGAWQGSFSAELFRVELPAGGVKEWKTDDGKQASGDGQLSLDVSPDGTALGNARGALGELTVSGRFEEERAALALAPVTPGGFQGVLLAEKSSDGLKGTLRASSGDSLQVRRADVTLSRAGK